MFPAPRRMADAAADDDAAALRRKLQVDDAPFCVEDPRLAGIERLASAAPSANGLPEMAKPRSSPFSVVAPQTKAPPGSPDAAV